MDVLFSYVHETRSVKLYEERSPAMYMRSDFIVDFFLFSLLSLISINLLPFPNFDVRSKGRTRCDLVLNDFYCVIRWTVNLPLR